MQARKISALLILSIITVSTSNKTFSQNKTGVISGPWAGNVEMRTATIWIEVSPSVKSIAVKYFPEGSAKNFKTVSYKGQSGNDFNPIKIDLNGLLVNTTYNYTIVVDGKQIVSSFPLSFTTKDLWEWRKPAPDFTFLAGSCAYFNEPIYDRPGAPYGGDSSIFESMSKQKAAFHVWMGDNWYTRESDYSSVWGLKYRASHDRSLKVLQKFMAGMPQYAIWDDHDFGPNDEGKSYILKDESRKVFMNYTCNPSYGEDNKGIYTKISYSDVDIFLTDDRYFRSEDNMPDSIAGKPDTAKTFFGRIQMDWLKNSLSFSKATFKVIVIGNQVLNPLSEVECMRQYSAEYNELLNFLSSQKISGVIFFTGDRHHSEVIKKERTGLYPLYDVTISPYTAGVSKVKGNELNSPFRIAGTLVEQQNFGRITVSGKKDERKLEVEFLGIKGEPLGKWHVMQSELKSINR
jgi:alkaline phosphatase D